MYIVKTTGNENGNIHTGNSRKNTAAGRINDLAWCMVTGIYGGFLSGFLTDRLFGGIWQYGLLSLLLLVFLSGRVHSAVYRFERIKRTGPKSKKNVFYNSIIQEPVFTKKDNTKAAV